MLLSVLSMERSVTRANFALPPVGSKKRFSDRNVDTDAYKFTDNYVFNSNLVNQFRFQFSRFEPQFVSSNPTDPVVLITLNDTLSGTDNRGGTLIAGNSTNQTNFNFPGTRKETRFQFQETLNAVIGSA
ncbi:MAG: hypothetical protein WKF71_19730 [Pyrinomonadaceae bacterium]